MKRILTAFLCAVLLFCTSCSYSAVPKSDGVTPLAPDNEIPRTIGLLNPDSEVRGVWIATVGNINFPSKKGLSAQKLRSELDDIIKVCTENGLNTVFFQVRPCADALYRSELFPQSEFVSGRQGQSPDGNFDCLEYLINEAKKQKINVHAWVNPLRVTYGSASSPKTDVSALSQDNPARKNPAWTIPYADGKLYFDAGNPEVREYIARGVAEIVENYAVDGIVFDDYFYPYPVTENGKTADFDDSASYEKYGAGAKKDDWRRENINILVRDCFNAVKSANSACLFGISPFGIWQNDDGKNGGSNTRGLEAYRALYCDAVAWAKGGYVDYIAPQLYWQRSTAAAPYETLANWWNSVLDGTGVDLLIAHGVYNYDSWESPQGELTAQIELSRDLLCYKGSVLYGYAALKADSHGALSETREAFDEDIIYSDAVPDYSQITVEGGTNVTTSAASYILKGHADPAQPFTVNGRGVSRDKSGNFQIEIKLYTGENKIVLKSGNITKTVTVTRE